MATVGMEGQGMVLLKLQCPSEVQVRLQDYLYLREHLLLVTCGPIPSGGPPGPLTTIEVHLACYHQVCPHQHHPEDKLPTQTWRHTVTNPLFAALTSMMAGLFQMREKANASIHDNSLRVTMVLRMEMAIRSTETHDSPLRVRMDL